MPNAVTAPPMIAKPRGPSRSQSAASCAAERAAAAWPASRGSTARTDRGSAAELPVSAGRRRGASGCVSGEAAVGGDRTHRTAARRPARRTFTGSGIRNGCHSSLGDERADARAPRRRARGARSRSRRCGSEHRLERPSRPPVGAGAGRRVDAAPRRGRSRVLRRGGAGCRCAAGRPPFSRRAIALCEVAQSRASSTCESPRASRRSVTCAAIEAKSQPSSAWARRRRSRSNGSAGGRFARRLWCFVV